MEGGKRSVFLIAPVNRCLELQLHFCKTSRTCLCKSSSASGTSTLPHLLGILHRNRTVRGGFPNPNSENPGWSRDQKAFPSRDAGTVSVSAAVGGEAVPELCPPRTSVALRSGSKS